MDFGLGDDFCMFSTRHQGNGPPTVYLIIALTNDLYFDECFYFSRIYNPAKV